MCLLGVTGTVDRHLIEQPAVDIVVGWAFHVAPEHVDGDVPLGDLEVYVLHLVAGETLEDQIAHVSFDTAKGDNCNRALLSL